MTYTSRSDSPAPAVDSAACQARSTDSRSVRRFRARQQTVQSQEYTKAYNEALLNWPPSDGRSVAIQSGYVMKVSEKSDPPLWALARGGGVVPVRLHLAIMGVHHGFRDKIRASAISPVRDSGPAWSVYAGIPGARSRDQRARKVRVGMNSLRDLDLVRYPDGKQDAWERFYVRPEAGIGLRRPRVLDDDKSFSLPDHFWAKGWYLALSPGEIHALFAAIAHQASLHESPLTFGLPEARRQRLFGMSSERYAEMRNLVALGLMTCTEPPRHPARGPMPGGAATGPGAGRDTRSARYRLSLNDLRHDALEVIRAAKPPPRFIDQA